MGNFNDAIRTDRELLRTVLQLQRSFYEQWGRWPSTDDIRAQLHLTETPGNPHADAVVPA